MKVRTLLAALFAMLALGACCGDDSSSSTSLFANMCLQEDEKAAEPAGGLWWNAGEEGRGFFIERQDEQLAVSAFLFEEDGRATWYTGRAHRNSDGRYSGTLVRKEGGQTLTGSYRAPTAAGDVATMVLDFDSATAGRVEVQLSGKSDKHAITLEQFRGDGGPPSNASFANGTWWNPDESGRSFAVEVQGSNVRFTSFVFEDAGRPIWYSGRGTLATASSFTVTLTQMADGQTLTGAYKQPTTVNASVGTVTFVARATDRATLTLPGGKQVQLQRVVLD